MLGTARSFNDSNGAKADPTPVFGGVRGRHRQNAARANEAMPATKNVLVKAASIAGPSLGRSQSLSNPGNDAPGLGDATAPWPSRSG